MHEQSVYGKSDKQVPNIKIYRSIERPTLTTVFGTSVPPSGVSGVVRDVAYRLGEGKKARWLLLLLADRVNVIEGFVSDLAHGHVPNIYKEMGLKSEFKYNRNRSLRKLFLIAGIVGTASSLLFAQRRLKFIAGAAENI